MTPSLHVPEVRLHDYLDDELPAAEARALEDHVAGCPPCADRLGDLAEVRTALGALPRSGMPARDLWPDIARRLDPDRSTRILALPGATGVAPDPAAARAAPRVRGGGSFRRLAYAAGLVGAFAAGTLVWRGAGPEPAAPVDRVAVGATFAASTEVRAAIVELEAILTAGRDRLDPATVEVIDRSLATIDTAIAEAEAALDRDPSSRLLQDLLLSQERAKVRVLTRAATRLLPST